MITEELYTSRPATPIAKSPTNSNASLILMRQDYLISKQEMAVVKEKVDESRLELLGLRQKGAYLKKQYKEEALTRYNVVTEIELKHSAAISNTKKAFIDRKIAIENEKNDFKTAILKQTQKSINMINEINESIKNSIKSTDETFHNKLESLKENIKSFEDSELRNPLYRLEKIETVLENTSEFLHDEQMDLVPLKPTVEICSTFAFEQPEVLEDSIYSEHTVETVEQCEIPRENCYVPIHLIRVFQWMKNYL